MTLGDPHQNARSAHRRAAVAMIEAAHRNGWLTGPDRDLRVGQAGTARTVGELDALIRDIEAHGYAGGVGAPGPVPQPLPQQPPYGIAEAGSGFRLPQLRSRSREVSPFGILGVVVAGLVLVSILGGALAAIRGGGPHVATGSQSAEQVIAAPDEPYALTAAGLGRFLDDYRLRFGSTRVVGATFYRGYVVVDVPVAGQRQQMWVYRDGEFTTDGDRTGRRDPVVDLARVDRAALGRNLRTAGDRLRVRKPTTVYALLTRRDPGSPARFQIYAGNDVDSYGYFVTTLAGKVLEEHPADG
ncbi:MAG: DUF1707 domain-containing protein [Nocardioidaceae bacterium]